MGRIAAPFGVQGWLKVLPSTAAPDTLLSHREWWLRPRGADWQKRALQSGKPHGNTLIVHLSGLTDREAAATLAGADIGVPRSSLPAEGANEVYFADLVGLAVRNRQGELLGRVAAVQEYGAHPVLRVEDGEGEARLIPFVSAYVDAVDRKAGVVEVDWQRDY